MLNFVLGVLLLLMMYYTVCYAHDLWRHRHQHDSGSFFVGGVIGLVTDFLDTLGIGSFATTTLLFDLTHQLDDDCKLPGTLNVAHTLPVMVEAFVFTKVIQVEMTTLIPMMIAATVGAWIGARFVNRLNQRKIQYFMGISLLITAVLMVLKQTGVLAFLGEGNTQTGLHGIFLVIAVVGNLFFGFLGSFGVGLYAPCMALVSLLGLNPLVSFPIMMCSCATILPVASTNFIKAGRYNRKLSLAITIFGIVGVLFAAFFVTNLNLNVLTWIVIAVVIYTAITYLRKSRRD